MRQIKGTVNRVELIGWTGDAPESRILPSGTAVVTFSVATKRPGPRNEAGERTYATDWTNVEAWEQVAASCARYLHKGSRVRVIGSLTTQSWEDRESGQRRYKTFVRAQEVLFLDARQESNGETLAAASEETEEAPF
ncbi:MAG TPA: single-stranded DNA-binding protein [Roseiflexaceae bacterium]|nr:single-stranded DNA-binding protein [Roseiflexaceae bacterium]